MRAARWPGVYYGVLNSYSAAGQLQDFNLVARRIGRSRRVMVASPAYLPRHGIPQTVDELVGHNCRGFNFRCRRWSGPTCTASTRPEPGLAGALLKAPAGIN
jgi:DNA-binding transcriptional LysR family regulator